MYSSHAKKANIKLSPLKYHPTFALQKSLNKITVYDILALHVVLFNINCSTISLSYLFILLTDSHNGQMD